MGYNSSGEAKKDKWFSRRYKTSEGREAHWDRIREEERIATEEAAERGAERAEAEANGPLSLIRRLNDRLGVGRGAQRERAKLAFRLEAKRMGIDISDVVTFAQLRGRIAMAKAKAEGAAGETAKEVARNAPAPRPKG